MIAKYVECIADHSTNIAQWVMFVVKNELKKLSSECQSRPPQQWGFCFISVGVVKALAAGITFADLFFIFVDLCYNKVLEYLRLISQKY